jgi:hypothetical protein
VALCVVACRALLQFAAAALNAVMHCRFAQGNEANVVHQLLDEVLSTALERAIEPQLLEGMVLDKIMGSQTPS